MAWNKLRLIMVLLAAFVALPGCIPRFTLNGSAIDYTVYKTIHVSEFPIRAALVYPPLQQTFENELLDYITACRPPTVRPTCSSKAKSPVTRYRRRR